MVLTFRLASRLGLLLPLVVGCAASRPRVACCIPQPARGVVYVVDGAGAHDSAPRKLETSVLAMGLPLDVRPFPWSHGLGLGLADVLDVAHTRREGGRLAAEVVRCQRERPDLPVSLVGYSAGCAVVLAAAECLPADSLGRIVLLAPAVSSSYDLRPALASARGGLDAFISERDRLWLGFGTAIAGTSDGRHEPAAGRVGFQPPTVCPGEAWLADRLKQHPWSPYVAWTGHTGGHSGSLQPCYLQSFVLPLLAPDERRVTRTPSTSP